MSSHRRLPPPSPRLGQPPGAPPPLPTATPMAQCASTARRFYNRAKTKPLILLVCGGALVLVVGISAMMIALVITRNDRNDRSGWSSGSRHSDSSDFSSSDNGALYRLLSPSGGTAGPLQCPTCDGGGRILRDLGPCSTCLGQGSIRTGSGLEAVCPKCKGLGRASAPQGKCYMCDGDGVVGN